MARPLSICVSFRSFLTPYCPQTLKHFYRFHHFRTWTFPHECNGITINATHGRRSSIHWWTCWFIFFLTDFLYFKFQFSVLFYPRPLGPEGIVITRAVCLSVCPYGGFPDDNICFEPIHFLFYMSIYMGSLWKPIDFGGVSIIINPVMLKNTYTISYAWPAGRGYRPSAMSCFNFKLTQR